MNFNLRPLAPAHFIGMQDGCGIFPAFALYVLEAPVGIHPEGSTVSEQTLERYGYTVPKPEKSSHSENDSWATGGFAVS